LKFASIVEAGTFKYAFNKILESSKGEQKAGQGEQKAGQGEGTEEKQNGAESHQIVLEIKQNEEKETPPKKRRRIEKKSGAEASPADGGQQEGDHRKKRSRVSDEGLIGDGGVLDAFDDTHDLTQNPFVFDESD